MNKTNQFLRTAFPRSAKLMLGTLLLLIAMLMPQGVWAAACAYTPECASIEDMQIHLNGTNGNYNGSADNAVQASLKFNYWLDIFNYDGDNGYWAKDLTMKIDDETLTFYTDYDCKTVVSTDYSTVLHGVWGVFGDSNEDHTIGKNKSGSGGKAYFKTSSGLKGYINIYNYYAASNKWTTMKVEVFIYDLYGHKVSVCGTYKRSGKSDNAYKYVFYLGGCPRPTNVGITRDTSKKQVNFFWDKQTYSIPSSDLTGETRVKAWDVIDNGRWGVYRDNYSTLIKEITLTMLTSATDAGATCSDSPYTYYVCYEPEATYANNGTRLKGSETSQRGLGGSQSITLDHIWGDDASWSWQEDGKSATCTRTCTQSDDHTTSKTVTLNNGITYKTKTAATCTERGTNTYEATATVAGTEYSDTKDVDIVALGHDYSTDGVCLHDASHYKEPTLSGGYYQIASYGNLCWFRNEANSGKAINAKLTADINLSGKAWATSIGEGKEFAGIFDGQSHTITGNARKALFCVLKAGSTVKNVVSTGATSKDNYENAAYQSPFVRRNYGTIENCIVKNAYWDSRNNYLGGITGVNENGGIVRNCGFYDSNLRLRNSANTQVGGIVGVNCAGGTIENCFTWGIAYMNIGSAGSGGIVCENRSGATIMNCYTNNATSVFKQEGTATSLTAGITAAFITTGEMCYKLNGGTSNGSQQWYQKIGAETFPTPAVKNTSTGTVYQIAYFKCDGKTLSTTNFTYSNNSSAQRTVEGHGSADYTPTYTWEGSHDAATCTFTLKCNACNTNVVNNQSLTPSKVQASHADPTCGSVGKEQWTVAAGTYSKTGDVSYTGTAQTEDYTIPATGNHNFAAEDTTQSVCLVCNHGFLRYTSKYNSITKPWFLSELKDAYGNECYLSNSYVNGKGVIEFERPLVTIGERAFYRSTNFNGELILPNTVKIIGKEAFAGCTGFTGNIVIPDSVTTIGDYAFQDCSNFNGVLTIGKSVTSIGRQAFDNCGSLTGVEMHSVPKVGLYGFQNVTDDKTVVLSDNSFVCQEGENNNPQFPEVKSVTAPCTLNLSGSVVANHEKLTLKHATIVDESVAATCTTAGHTEGSHCDLCNKTLVAQQTIPALGHQFAINLLTKDTKADWELSNDEIVCSDDHIQFGYSYQTAKMTVAVDASVINPVKVSCDYQIVCAGILNGSASISVDLLDKDNNILDTKTLLDWSGFNYEMASKETVSATIDLPAGTRYVRMMVGGRDQKSWAGNYGPIFSNMSISAPSITKEPTCTEKGTEVLHCMVCGLEGEKIELPALGHEWCVTEVEPTCTTDGQQTRHCTHSGCTETQEVILPALGYHRYGLVNPTENNRGNWVLSGNAIACGDGSLQFSYKPLWATQTVAVDANKISQVVASCDYQIVCAGGQEGLARISVDLLDKDNNILDTKTLLNWSGRNYEMASEETVSATIDLPAGTRYVRMMVGGNDQKYWEGNYGPIFSNMSISAPSITKEPTCTDKGTGFLHCMMCALEGEEFEIDALGHDLVDGECTRCGYATIVKLARTIEKLKEPGADATALMQQISDILDKILGKVKQVPENTEELEEEDFGW